MPEYAGKVNVVNPLDFSALTGGVIDSLRGVHQRRQAEKAELDMMYTSADTEAQQTEQFQNQTLNTLVTNGVDKVRDEYYALNQELKAGRLKPSEYRARVNNTQSGLSMFANTAKTYDATMKNFLERQQPGEKGMIDGSGFEQYMSGVYADMSDLGNKDLTIDPSSGKLFLTQYNSDGTVGGTTDVTRMSNPGNMIDNRYDLSGSIELETDMWEDYKISSGSGWKGFTNIDDVRQNPSFQYAVDAKVQSVLSNNRSTASVLVDNGIGDYNYFQTKEELAGAILAHVESAKRVAIATGSELSEQQLVDIARDKQDKMIRVEYDRTGTMQPVPSKDQYDAARERVVAEIEIQLGHDESKTSGWKPAATTGGGGDDDGGSSYATYATINEAWRTGNADQLMALNPKYNIVATKGGEFEITLKEDEDPELVLRGGELVNVAHPGRTIKITNARDLAPFMYRTGTKGGDAPLDRFDSEKRAFRSERGSGKKKSAGFDPNQY